MKTFPNSYALVIGVANYPYFRPLPQAVLNDARDVAALLSSHSCGYPPKNIKTLLDKEADKQGIRDGFKWLAEQCAPEDTAFVFISSHGGQGAGENGGNSYLLPYDCRPQEMESTGISAQDLTLFLRAIKARKMVVFFDFCFSGGAGEPKSAGAQFPFKNGSFHSEAYEQLAEGTGRVIIASSRPDEVSRILPGMSNSLFTHYLLESLKGGAYSRGDGFIRIFDVFHFLADSIPSQADQHPYFKAADLENNFPVALYAGGKQVKGESAAAIRKIDKRLLRETLTARFSRDEMETLCADVEQDLTDNGISLRVSLELAGGNASKEKQALDLIGYLERQGYLEYLVRAIRRLRPGVACQLYP